MWWTPLRNSDEIHLVAQREKEIRHAEVLRSCQPERDGRACVPRASASITAAQCRWRPQPLNAAENAYKT